MLPIQAQAPFNSTVLAGPVLRPLLPVVSGVPSTNQSGRVVAFASATAQITPAPVGITTPQGNTNADVWKGFSQPTTQASAGLLADAA